MPTLEWIGKDKVVNYHQQVPFRVLERKYSFKENGQHEEDNNSENMIIHGDNLETLKALLPKYEGRIKCIYSAIAFSLRLTVSTYGSDGGYEIMDGFKLTKQIAGVDDYLNIIIALKGLCSAYNNSKINTTLEKALATMQGGEQHVLLILQLHGKVSK